MATLNQYSLYSYAVNDFKSACDDKILVDLQMMKSLEYFDEVEQFVDKTFGKFNAQKVIDYPNDVKLTLLKYPDIIIVAATQGEKQIFGTCWERPKEE